MQWICCNTSPGKQADQALDRSHPVLREVKCSAQDHQLLDSRYRSWNCALWPKPGVLPLPGATPPLGFLTPAPAAAHAGGSDFLPQLQVSPHIRHQRTGGVTGTRAGHRLRLRLYNFSALSVWWEVEGWAAEVPDSWISQRPSITAFCSEIGRPGPPHSVCTLDLLTFRILRSVSWGSSMVQKVNLCTLFI